MFTAILTPHVQLYLQLCLQFHLHIYSYIYTIYYIIFTIILSDTFTVYLHYMYIKFRLLFTNIFILYL